MSLATTVLCPLMLPAAPLWRCSDVVQMYSSFNLKNTSVITVVIVHASVLGHCKGQRTRRAPGVLSHPANADDWLLAYYVMDRNCLKIESSECTVMVTVSSALQKEYRNKLPDRLLFMPHPGKKYTNKIKKKYKKYRLDYWSGPFATALG